MRRGQCGNDVILGVSDRAFCPYSAMILCGGIFDGNTFSAEEIFKLRGRLIVDSLNRNMMLELAEECESGLIRLHVRVSRSTGHRLQMHIVIEHRDKDVLMSLTRNDGKSTSRIGVIAVAEDDKLREHRLHPVVRRRVKIMVVAIESHGGRW